MKINYEEMWTSCEFFIPQIKVLREKKISTNLPTWAEKVAVKIFLVSDTAEFKSNFEALKFSANVREYLVELESNGYVAFEQE